MILSVFSVCADALRTRIVGAAIAAPAVTPALSSDLRVSVLAMCDSPGVGAESSILESLVGVEVPLRREWNFSTKSVDGCVFLCWPSGFASWEVRHDRGDGEGFRRGALQGCARLSRRAPPQLRAAPAGVAQEARRA